jgi:hypothetical protein
MEDSPLKATDFGLSDFIKPGTCFTVLWICASLLHISCCIKSEQGRELSNCCLIYHLIAWLQGRSSAI